MNAKKLSFKIPPGVESGSRLRLQGEGELGDMGGPPGDLYVFIRVEEHELFRREGDDVVVGVPMTYSQAALGGTVEIPSLEGTETLTIPSGTQSGQEFRIASKEVFPDVAAWHARVLLVLPVDHLHQALRQQAIVVLLHQSAVSGIDRRPQHTVAGKTA